MMAEDDLLVLVFLAISGMRRCHLAAVQKNIATAGIEEGNGFLLEVVGECEFVFEAVGFGVHKGLFWCWEKEVRVRFFDTKEHKRF
jgi:hypothetical protein